MMALGGELQMKLKLTFIASRMSGAGVLHQVGILREQSGKRVAPVDLTGHEQIRDA